MTTESSLDNETWSTVTEQTILLQDGLKFVADLVSAPEFDSNSLSTFVDCEFRFESSWIAKLAQRLQAVLCMQSSPYQLYFDFRQRTILSLWLSQRKRLKTCKKGDVNGDISKTAVEKRKPVSFSSHVSLLLLLPLLESQSKIDPSLPISCTELLLHCLREYSPYSLSSEPRSCLDGLERLLCSWLDIEASKQTQSAEVYVSTSRREDIVAALIALACGRLSLKSLIQVLLILQKHRTSLHNISTHEVLQRTLTYTRTGKHTPPTLLKTSNFVSRWHCKPFPDSSSNVQNDEKCTSIACDGKFLYVTCSGGKGLAKIGTGRMGSFRGLLYNINLSIAAGWVVWNHGFLIFRPAVFDTNRKVFCFMLDPSTLKIKCNVEFKDSLAITNQDQVCQVSTVQLTSDGVHLYWIFTLSSMPTDQPQEPQQDQSAYDLCIWGFRLEEIEDEKTMSQKIVAVPLTPHHMTIDLGRVDENDAAGLKQAAQTPMNVQFKMSNLGLARNNLSKIPMFVASDMLVLVLPHYSLTNNKGHLVLRAKRNPINCCFSLVDDHCIIRESLIDTDNSVDSWQDFGITRLGVCIDPMDGAIWTYGDGHVCEWTNTGYPSMNQVKDQLAITNDPFGPLEGDQMDVNNVISSIAIKITILSRSLEAQLSALRPVNPDTFTEALLDSNYLTLIYEALHLGIVSKNHTIILTVLHALQPLLQLAVTRRIKLENQLVKDLRSLVWMLVCTSTESYSRQIHRQACRVFVRGLSVFYRGSKEQSALLMVLLSDTDSKSNGIFLMREMLLRDMAAKLVNTEKYVDFPNRLAYDVECKLIKACVMVSTTDILQCVNLAEDDLAKFLAAQPDVSASLQYITTLVTKTWKELMLSEDCTMESSLVEMSEFVTKNVESIMLASKILEASQELLEVVLEALQKLQNNSQEVVWSRLDGLEKVIKATPVGQLLLFMVTIMANQKFCSLPLAKSLLSRVTSTTITATKAANLFHHMRAAANSKSDDSVLMPTLQSSLPQLTPWTHSCIVESIHPIRDDYRYSKTVTFKGAKCLYLKFDPRCATQYEYDKVMVYAGPNTTAAKVGEFGGNVYGYGSKGVIRLGWPKDFITVDGDSVTFVFQVKSTRERTTPDKAVWGFACSVSLKKGHNKDEDVALPVLTDVALGLSHLNYKLLSVLYDGPATISEEEACSHLLNSQLLQRCIWEESEGMSLQESQANGIKITITQDQDQPPTTTPKVLPRQPLSTELTKRIRNASGILAPTLRPSIRHALEPEAIEEVVLSAVIRHLNLYDKVHGLELLQVANADSTEYVKLCEVMREVFRRIDGILRQLQAMAEVELRWSQEIEDLRQGLLQPSAAFFNEYHLQEVKSKDLELLCSLKGIVFDPMEQERVVGKLIQLLENEAKSRTNDDSEDLLERMPKTRALRHSIIECGELLCSVTIQSPLKKRGPPGRSVSHGTFVPRAQDYEHQLSDTSSVNRSFSAPTQLHRSMSVREGAQDLRRLQRWRTAIQKKKQTHDVGSKPDTNEDNMELVSIMDDIFAFIGSDPDKEVSYSSFLSAARLRNERGLSRVQALLHMHELIGVCANIPGHVPQLIITIASILSQGPRIEELKCGGMATAVREEFTNVVQALLQQASTDPIVYSNSILVLSVCPFSWQEERCVIRSGLISLLDRLCILGRDQSQSSRNTASMAWASFQVLLDRFVQWENDDGYQADEIEWSGLAYQVSSLITNYLNFVLEESRKEITRARDSLQYILKLLQSIAGSKMGEAILQQSCTVSTLLAVLLDPRAPPKLVLTVLKLCRAALPLMTTNSCEQLTLPVTAERYLNRDDNAADLKPVLKVAKLLLAKLGDFILPCVQNGKRLQYGKNGNCNGGVEGTANDTEKTEQYIVYVHKRSDQPSHEVVQTIVSHIGHRFVFRVGLGTEVDRAVRLDHELTENNKAVIMTDVFSACVTKASSLAAMGLVTSVLPAYHRQQESFDKGLVSSENVCSVRNQILASESCRPFVSGQVAHTMASEVISLLQSLLTSPSSDAAKLWSSAVKQVLSDALNSVSSLMERLGKEIDRSIMHQGQETEEDEETLTVAGEELMMVSGQVMAALCSMGGFNHTVYAGCNAKIIGEDMVAMTCEVMSTSDGMATILLDDSTQAERLLDIPLVRLELPHKEPVSLNKVELVEQAIESLYLILKTRDVTLPKIPESEDSNALLLETSAARVLCELKTRASMVLTCQMKDPVFCDAFTSHHSQPLQTMKALADLTDPGKRLAVLDSQCQELRKLFKDLVKPVDRRHNGKTKPVALDIRKEYPPIKGVVFTEGYRVAHMMVEGENIQNLPRGAYLYATQSIPLKAPSYYWEVEILSLARTDTSNYVGSGSSLSIGIAPTISHPADKWATPVGACVLHDNGIAVHYKRGGFTNWETTNTGLTIQNTHVIGCSYTRSEDDVDHGSVYFTHDGQRLPGVLHGVRAGLWPVVHLQRKDVKVRVNFGSHPFVYAKGSKIRQAADLASDSMEEVRQLLLELPFAGVENDSDEEARVMAPIKEVGETKLKKIPEPLSLSSDTDIREYDPSASLTYMLSSSCDVMTDTGPLSHMEEDDSQKQILDSKNASPTELLVKAWEENVFPVISRRFRNEADRRSGLEQIRGALQAGMMDIAVATLEDLYEDTGGIPNTLTLPRLEDVKEDANKLSVSNIRQGMAVVVSSKLNDTSMAGFAVPEMKRTYGLTGIVLTIDK
ncbi:probable E3 ubiquitin-protein ligase HECTD4, partial [Actinia tenebrosa]|uniref:Probable E3 ubiquitin-protein ligase HECTD4 n=1 Tax=Actinia tenebrosa TaxID=6105 RepID=A0A6P8HQI5_ACTTE